MQEDNNDENDIESLIGDCNLVTFSEPRQYSHLIAYDAFFGGEMVATIHFNRSDHEVIIYKARGYRIEKISNAPDFRKNQEKYLKEWKQAIMTKIILNL